MGRQVSAELDRAILGHLQGLVAHPGWALVAERIGTARDAAHGKAIGAGTPRDERGEWAAAYRALEDALGWPSKTIDDIHARLNRGASHG